MDYDNIEEEEGCVWTQETWGCRFRVVAAVDNDEVPTTLPPLCGDSAAAGRHSSLAMAPSAATPVSAAATSRPVRRGIEGPVTAAIASVGAAGRPGSASSG